MHALRNQKDTWTNPVSNARANLPDSVVALSETCIQCSRHSYRLLTDAWLHGSFHIFDYFNTQYLFATANVLAVSSLLGSAQSAADGDCFNNAVELLGQLDRTGNFAANEYGKHLAAMKQSMSKINAPGVNVHAGPAPRSISNPTQEIVSHPGAAMTAGMALAEPSLQELLAEPDLNLQLFDTPVVDGLQTPYWPELWGDDWTAT